MAVRTTVMVPAGTSTDVIVVGRMAEVAVNVGVRTPRIASFGPRVTVVRSLLPYRGG